MIRGETRRHLPFIGGKFKGALSAVNATRESAAAASAALSNVGKKKRGKGSPGVYHRALGGPVTPRSAYMVGERGPEMFVPNAAGNIVPGGGGSGPIHVHLHVGTHKVAEAILPDLQRLGKRTSAQQRGRLGGVNVALT